MQRELEYFTVDENIGFDQDRFADAWMKRGGCGLVTACDLCICLARDHGMQGLYPYDPHNITAEEYTAFAVQMRKYLGPRPMGIWKTEMYTEGLSAYMDSIGYRPLSVQDFSGKGDVEEAVQLVKTQIDKGYPVPYLMLLHRDKKLGDYMWHWFNLTGYEDNGNRFLVKIVTYGKENWVDLRHLWRTDRRRRGGLVIVECK
ncbi:MAG: hypothetical protein IJJ29_11415 [Solobacterium sp.]|nr:hypothetical protein [Solobacterium sp.]